MFEHMPAIQRVEVAAMLVGDGCRALRSAVSASNDNHGGDVGVTPVLDPESAPDVAQTLKRIRRVIDDTLGAEHERVVAVSADDALAFRVGDNFPKKVLEAYELLYEKTYGPAGAQGLGDPNAGQARDGVGRGRQFRMENSGHDVYRAGAVTKRDKSKRNVVKDSEAFAFKRALDKRLSRVAADILLFLDGGRESVVTGTLQCSCCRTIVSRDARYCGSCGSQLKKENE